uniref:ACR-16-like protein n=1 Tax=Trichuris muris TaxID=70415 RepID=A0A5S6R3I6_TRIMR|nr:ACR-16-like protein [Trichuris muris]
MPSLRLIISAYIKALLFCIGCALADIHERQLSDDLLRGYNVLERPVDNCSKAVDVTLELVLFQIVNVDEKSQTMQTNVWLKFSWQDYNLKWSPEEYGGLTDIRIPPEKIWKPDVILYNNVDADFQSYFPSNVIVYYNGQISWIPPAILQSSCKLDITWFPFDDQQCCLKFGSWTYNGNKLNLIQSESGWDLSEYLENGEWLLTDAPVKRNVKLYNCCPDEPYVDVKYCLNIRRRTLYYGFNMIIPSVLISLMTLLGFLLPVESGEKLTLEITILLSVCVFLTMVGQMTPSTSEALPLIGIFFSCNMIVVSASVVSNVLVLNLHYRSPDSYRMGPLASKVLLRWLPKVLRMRPPESPYRSCEEKQQLLTNNVQTEQSIPRAFSMLSADDLAVCHELKELRKTVVKLLANTRRIKEVLLKECEDEQSRSEWKFAATVVDRLCFVIFSAVIIISSCGIFASSPHLTV